MLDKTKKLIETEFVYRFSSERDGHKYEIWQSKDFQIAIAWYTGFNEVQFNFDYANVKSNWFSEEEGWRRMKLVAFW